MKSLLIPEGGPGSQLSTSSPLAVPRAAKPVLEQQTLHLNSPASVTQEGQLRPQRVRKTLRHRDGSRTLFVPSRSRNFAVASLKSVLCYFLSCFMCSVCVGFKGWGVSLKNKSAQWCVGLELVGLWGISLGHASAHVNKKASIPLSEYYCSVRYNIMAFFKVLILLLGSTSLNVQKHLIFLERCADI